jgi:CBS domain-containing protein
MNFVAEILKAKGRDVWTVSSDSTVYDALQEMADKNVGALLVVEDDKLVGVFSERDYARKVILHGKASKDTLVKEIMSTEMFWVRPDQTVAGCMELMTNKRIRHLPVLDEGRLVGVISIGDVVKAVISEKEFAIQQLEQYITSGIR